MSDLILLGFFKRKMSSPLLLIDDSILLRAELFFTSVTAAV